MNRKSCVCVWGVGCVAGVRSEPESGANSVGQASGEEWKVGVRGWRQAFKINKIGYFWLRSIPLCLFAFMLKIKLFLNCRQKELVGGGGGKHSLKVGANAPQAPTPLTPIKTS